MGGFSVVVFMSILSFIFLFLIAIFAVIVLYTIISYIFESISIMCMSKNKGNKNSFIAWIPFYNKYVLGKIVDNKVIGGILGILTFLSNMLCIYFYIHNELEIVLFVILIIFLIVSFILDLILAHRIYKSSSKYADVLTIFSILSLGLLRPIFLFALRNKLIKN